MMMVLGSGLQKEEPILQDVVLTNNRCLELKKMNAKLQEDLQWHLTALDEDVRLQ
jgi:hypothetical protein